MSRSFVSIGIDISKPLLDIHGLHAQHPKQVDNTPEGIAALVGYLEECQPDLIVCEPSGGYERSLVHTLQQAGLPIALVNARQIRHFARAKGILAKTDTLDARVLAEYGEAIKPQPQTPEKDTLLAEYVQRRRQLTELLRREKQQREHLTLQVLQHHSEALLAQLDASIAEIDACIRAHIAADPEKTERHATLVSCKGVGDITAAVLLAEMPELGRASHAQIAALAGLAPFNCDSGSMRGIRRIKGGRGDVRKALYMATISAIRYNPDIKKIFDRLRKNGKHAKVAITACMRKLLITLNSLIRDNRKWKECYAKTTA